MRRPIAVALALLSIWASACGKSTGHPDSTLRASARGRAVDVSAAPSSVHYRNDGDRDFLTDADSDNRADVDDDAPLDYKDEGHENRSFHDRDDASVLAFGHETSAAEGSAIARAVRRYYAAAAAADGGSACAMLIPTLANAVVLDYGQGGPAYLRPGKNCAGVLKLLFRHYHRELREPPTVVGARVDGDNALALLGYTTMPAAEMSLRRVSGVWMIEGLLATPLP